MLLHAGPSGVVLEVEQVLRIASQRSHLDVEVRALEVGHGLKALLPYRVLLILRRNAIGSATVATMWSSHREVRAMCAIISTLVSGSLPMTDPNPSFVGLKGIVTLSSHLSKSWVLDSRQR
jgi:hypothetical protein